MTDDRSTFETTKARLEDIVTQVRRKDVSLEQSLDMLEEAVRLVNQCNELIDQTSWQRPDAAGEEPAQDDAGTPVSERTIEAVDTDGDGVIDVVEIVDEVDLDGDGTIDLIEVVDLVDTDGDGLVDTVLDTVVLRDGPDGEAEGAADEGPPVGSAAPPEDDARE
jgi:exodeoxyribonuclease VII small subunit